MARGIPAIVTPEVLQWARDLDRITIDEIAQKLNVDAAKVSAWENGNEHPSLTQAKKLAKQYRVPFAFFYLPDVPKRAKRLEKTDYRTFGNWGFPEMSRELRWFLRDIEDRRDIMIDLYGEAEILPTVCTLSISPDTSEERFSEPDQKIFIFDRCCTDQIQKTGSSTLVLHFQTGRAGFSDFSSSKGSARRNARAVRSLRHFPNYCT